MGNHNNRGGSGRPSFAKKSWEGNRNDRSGPMTLHKATCAECSKVCEVPFRPSGDRPVYCKDCFAGRGGGMGGDRPQKRDFGSHALAHSSGHSSAHAPTRPQFENRNNDVVTKQLEAVNLKLERLIKAVETLASNKTAKTKEEFKDAIATVVKKSPKKKAAKK